MKCPKCGYNSFEYLDSCKKCNNDLDGFKASHGIRAVVLPFCRRDRTTASAANEPDFSSDTSSTNTDEGRFNWQDSVQLDAATAAGGFSPLDLDMPDAAGEPFSFDLDFSAVEPEKPSEEGLKDFSLDDISGGDVENDGTEGVTKGAAPPADDSPTHEADSFGTLSFDDLYGSNEEPVVGQETGDTAAETLPDLFGTADEEPAPAAEPSAFSFDTFDEPESLSAPAASTEENSIEIADPFADSMEADTLSNPFEATNEENAVAGPAEFSFEETETASASVAAMEGGLAEEADPFAFSELTLEPTPAEPTEGEPADTLGLSKEEYESLFGKPADKTKPTDFSSSPFEDTETTSVPAAAMEGSSAESGDPFALDESAFEGNVQSEVTAEEPADTLGLSKEEYESLFGERPAKKPAK